jgi:hypothetical protein
VLCSLQDIFDVTIEDNTYTTLVEAFMPSPHIMIMLIIGEILKNITGGFMLYWWLYASLHL